MVVCGGSQLNYPLSTLIKSILRYRQQAIIFHLLADDVTMRIIPLLFDTWRLPAGGFLYLFAIKVHSQAVFHFFIECLQI